MKIYKVTNNPANIRYNPNNRWIGLTSSYKGFASFDHVYNGIRALYILLKNYYTYYRLNNVQKIISRFAPSSDNNQTDKYIEFVSGFLDVEPNEVLDFDNYRTFINLAYAIIKMESGQSIDLDYLVEVYEYTFGLSITKKLPKHLPISLYYHIYIDLGTTRVNVLEYNRRKAYETE